LGLLAGCARGWARDTPEGNRIRKSFVDVNGKRRKRKDSAEGAEERREEREETKKKRRTKT
jgi:hypothetical protein